MFLKLVIIFVTFSTRQILQVLDLIAFICASVYIPWGPFGGGWVQFVTMAAFITTLLLFGFHLFGVIHKLPGPWGLIVSGSDCCRNGMVNAYFCWRPLYCLQPSIMLMPIKEELRSGWNNNSMINAWFSPPHDHTNFTPMVCRLEYS